MTRLRWIKLWTQETITGTTSHELEPAERSLWFDFLALAGDSPVPGTVCVAAGIPYTDDQLCQMLNVPPSLLQRASDRMVKAGKITLNAGCIRISKWEHYQGDYIRMQEHRRRVTHVTPRAAVTKVTRRTEQSREDVPTREVVTPRKVSSTRATSAPASAGDLLHLPPQNPAKNYQQVAQLYAETFGPVTTAIAEVINDACLHYPLDWIGEAFKEAVMHQAKNFAYVKAILKSWGANGYKAEPPPKKMGRPKGHKTRKLPTGQQLQAGWDGKEPATGS